MRLLYGLERLPTTLSPDDPRLPAVTVGQGPLRLHSVAAPQSAWPERLDFASCWAAYGAWLQSACGAYRLAPRRFIESYLALVAAQVQAHRAELEEGLARYDGLYRATDWCWSAWRPLPLAWGPEGRVDMAFWTGSALIPATEANFPQRFWEGETLPVSPFRRVL